MSPTNGGNYLAFFEHSDGLVAGPFFEPREKLEKMARDDTKSIPLTLVLGEDTSKFAKSLREKGINYKTILGRDTDYSWEGAREILEERKSVTV
jgi:hypothetical protein